MKRRDFLKSALAATVVAGVGASQVEGAQAEGAAPASSDMPYRVLGHTGAKVSLIGLGGYHIGVQPEEAESTRIIRSALDRGINFLDNCWDYNGGVSEVRMGKALRDGYREKAFLMTKIDGRTRQSAEQQINESLKRLQTDHLDLLQIHEVIRPNDPDRVFAPGGSFEAVLAAKNAGKTRYIGFTGHKSPDIHVNMLETAFRHGFKFDSVQMPLNVMDAHYNSFEAKMLPLLVKHNIGVLGMKPMGAGVILKSNTASATECLHYAMSLPTSVVITGCDTMAILDQAIEAAKTFKAFTAAERDAVLAKTLVAARDGQFERYKTSTNFDGTAHNPQWLG